MARRLGGVRIGTSGYHYAHWRGRFYPPDLPQRAWFEHYNDDSAYAVRDARDLLRYVERARTPRWRRGAGPRARASARGEDGRP